LSELRFSVRCLSESVMAQYLLIRTMDCSSFVPKSQAKSPDLLGKRGA
jgi:hypothetical protein